MVTESEYALIAGAAYRSTRDPINRIPPPQGWQEVLNSHIALPTGFEAISFQRGNEIVISFAGTGQLVDWYSNIGLAIGAATEQLKQAAVYYEQFRAANPTAQISFTGHSLGGGLAALMGVFFNKTAVTFDPAPFRQAANQIVRDTLVSHLAASGFTNPDQDLASFTSDIGFPEGAPPGIRGEANVTGYSVQGEILSGTPLFNRIGEQFPLPQGTIASISSTDLHSQALLSAFFQDVDFRLVTEDLPNMLRLIFDSELFKFSTGIENTLDRNFIEHLVRHQAGVPDLFPADAMLTHFTQDMWDIAQAGGQVVDNANLNKALIAFGLQAYYEQTDAFTKEAYEKITGGVRFDRTTIAGDLSDIKGYGLYFLPYLQSRFSGEALGLITSQLPTLQDWFIASGAGGAIATAGDRTAFMLGADKQDQFTGSSRNDLIIGDAGNDVLEGRAGDDYLVGGSGFDTYRIRPNDGNDLILDTDGQGLIVYGADGATQALALGIRDTNDPTGQYHSLDGSITYQWSGSGDLIVTLPGAQTLTVKNFNQDNRDLHLALIDRPPRPHQRNHRRTGLGRQPVGHPRQRHHPRSRRQRLHQRRQRRRPCLRKRRR